MATSCSVDAGPWQIWDGKEAYLRGQLCPDGVLDQKSRLQGERSAVQEPVLL